MSFFKRKTYQMDIKKADSALQNIFAACNQSPNTIPFDKLVLRRKANTRIYNRLLTVTAVILLFTFLSPFYIVPLSHVTEKLLKPEPVVLLDDYLEDGILYLQLGGDNILYGEAYLETPEGQKISAIVYDTRKQLIGFPFLEEGESNIYIPIKNSEPLHFLLTPQ